MKSVFLKNKIFTISVLLIVYISANVYADSKDYSAPFAKEKSTPQVSVIYDGVLTVSGQEAKNVDGLSIDYAVKFSKPLDVIVKSITSEDNSKNISLLYDVNTSEYKLLHNDPNGMRFLENTYYIDKTKMEMGIEMSPTIYCFGANGKMVIGWMQDSESNWKFFSTKKDGTLGKMALGWTEIGRGNYYCFGPDGVMMRNMVTKEGKVLDMNGRCINW